MVTTLAVADALRDVYDPELGIDVVALGLVYAIAVGPPGVTVVMTTTSAACPMGAAIVESAEAVLAHHFPGVPVQVATEFDPPWDVAMCDNRARDWLGLPPAMAR